MFFKKKPAEQPEAKLEDLKTDDQHTQTYRLGGDDNTDAPAGPDPAPEQAAEKPAEAEEALKAEEAPKAPDPPQAAEAELPPPPETKTAPEAAVAEKKPEPAPQELESPKAKPAKPVADEPKSQVLQDMQEAGLTPEDVFEPAAGKSKKSARESGRRRRAEGLATVARFRWLVLLFLSLASVLAWAVEAQFSGRPYVWTAWSLFGASLLLGCLSFKLLRLPTRAGLAALCWGGSYLISAFYGPDNKFFNDLPTALVWGGLMSLIMIWVGVAIWRKIGRYRVVDIILSIIVIYAALGPLWSLVDNILAGQAFDLSFKVLSESPAFITGHLPWFLWPMTLAVGLVLPLAALFSLWDQFSAFRRRGARHGGNFFLSLAFLSLIPFGFFSFDAAVDNNPDLARDLRSVWPGEPAAPPQGRPLVLTAPGPAAPPLAEPEPTQAAEAAPEETAAPPEAPPAADEQPAPEAAADAAEADFVAPPQEFEAEIAASEPPTPRPDPPAESAPEDFVPAPAETEPETEAQPEAQKPAGLEERLAATEERLSRALERIEELEKQIIKLGGDNGQTDAPPASSAQPDVIPSPTAMEPAPEVSGTEMKSRKSPEGRIKKIPRQKLPGGFVSV